MTNPSQPQVALVTGANKGIGFEIARGLAQQGHQVLLGARDVARGTDAVRLLQREGLDVSLQVLDVTKVDSIREAARRVHEDFNRLDILVNNAGMTDPRDGLVSDVPDDVIRRVMETNFYGALNLTRALLPLLRRAAQGRIVNVSSPLASLTHNSDPEWELASFKMLAYSTSKTALNVFTVQLAHELRGTALKVNAVAPGYTRTDMTGHAGDLTPADSAVMPIKLATIGNDGPNGGFFNDEGQVPW
ncbi:SDR family oxidoreductase [Deinococcus aquatilis]|uniref:SDR family oxidoreductase n=1 Tax=Deinococcus aquatilis TaxID=519440 RepID=UPI00036A7963|nr:SDR family oxidoreductase [Deinococcus aquatilis]